LDDQPIEPTPLNPLSGSYLGGIAWRVQAHTSLDKAETVNQSISAPYFEDVVPIQTNLPVGGGFKTKGQTLSFITQAPQGEYKAKWEIKFLAHCAAEGKWKFAIKSANFTSVVLYDQNNIDEFPTSIIQSANCQATKDIEFAFHNGSLV